VPLLYILFFYITVLAQVQGETHNGLTAMPTYTYNRMPGTLGLEADEETWNPDKWRDRQVFGRFVPIMDWKPEQSSLWFYTGNEIGDELWQELGNEKREPNRTPMLYGGFATPLLNGFYAMAEFNQIDHFSEATFNIRKKRINSQKFSWFGENLPAYSGLFGGFGYVGDGDFLKNASILTGSEYLWAWNQEEWVPIRISPRIEGNAGFYFMAKEIELHAASEKFQIQDSAAEDHSHFGMRLKGENTGGGLYASQIKGEENIVVWMDFNHSFLQVFTNKGFIAFSSDEDKSIVLINNFADSLEYKINLSDPTDLTLGILLNLVGIKLYGETSYESKPLFMKLRAYKNYDYYFQSVGFDSEIAYKSRIAEAGLAYSREFFDYYHRDINKAGENFARLFLKYRFLQNLSFTHEWLYRDFPYSWWFWNVQIEQRIPKLNASLYAVWLNVLSKNNKKDFSFGGVNAARFYCGATLSF
jgi:hypothetical protein